MKSWEISSMAAVAEARRVMKPPETERSRTLSIGLAKASKDDRRTIVGLFCSCCCGRGGPCSIAVVIKPD